MAAAPRRVATAPPLPRKRLRSAVPMATECVGRSVWIGQRAGHSRLPPGPGAASAEAAAWGMRWQTAGAIEGSGRSHPDPPRGTQLGPLQRGAVAPSVIGSMAGRISVGTSEVPQARMQVRRVDDGDRYGLLKRGRRVGRQPCVPMPEVLRAPASSCLDVSRPRGVPERTAGSVECVRRTVIDRSAGTMFHVERCVGSAVAMR